LEFFVFWFVVSCKGPVKYKKWWGLTLCQFWPLTSANFVLSCLLLVLGMQVPGEQNNFGKPLMSRISRITALRFRRVSGGPRPKLYQSPFLLLFLTDHPNYIYIDTLSTIFSHIYSWRSMWYFLRLLCSIRSRFWPCVFWNFVMAFAIIRYSFRHRLMAFANIRNSVAYVRISFVPLLLVGFSVSYPLHFATKQPIKT